MGAEYLPFLAANAQALAEARSEVVVTLRGQQYRQAPFGYQGKCYADLRARWAALPDESQDSLRPPLEATGCLDWLDRSHLK